MTIQTKTHHNVIRIIVDELRLENHKFPLEITEYFIVLRHSGDRVCRNSMQSARTNHGNFKELAFYKSVEYSTFFFQISLVQSISKSTTH